MTPGEIAKGQFITILEEVEDETPAAIIGPMEMMMGRGKRASPYSGMPIEVLAVDLPYVLGRCGEGKVCIDTRAYRLMEMNREFVEAYTAKEKPGTTGTVDVNELNELADCHNNLANVVAQHERTLRQMAQTGPAAAKPWWRRLLRL